MKKTLSSILITLSLLTPAAALAQTNTHQGGTGVIDVSAGSILFGSTPAIRMATSSALQFNNSKSRLDVTNYNASTGTTTSATSTSLFVQTASTTNLYTSVGTCTGSNALNVVAGLITCGAVSGVGAASSTLLTDNNTWGTNGSNLFTASTTATRLSSVISTSTNATSTNFFATTASTTNLYLATGNGALSITSSGLVTAGTLSVANGGTGAATLTGCLTGNGTGAITGSGTCNTSNATVSSIATTWPISGGTITTTGTLTWAGLASSTNIANTQVLVATGVNTYASYSTLTFATAGALLTTTNASTTALTVSTFMNVISGGKLGIASTSPQFPFSVNTGGSNFYITTTGKVVAYDTVALNPWEGILTPTRSFGLGTGTTTTWTATTSGAYVPQLTMPFAGTLRSAQCTASTTAAFFGVAVYINQTLVSPAYFVASSTEGIIKFTSSNTFARGDIVSAYFGTTTSAAANVSASCTFGATETP